MFISGPIWMRLGYGVLRFLHIIHGAPLHVILGIVAFVFLAVFVVALASVMKQ